MLCFAVINPKETIHLGFHVSDMVHHLLHHLGHHHSGLSSMVAGHHHEHDDHEDLPSHQHPSDIFQPVTILSEKIQLELTCRPVAEEEEKLSSAKQIMPMQFVNSIWQPPRIG